MADVPDVPASSGGGGEELAKVDKKGEAEEVGEEDEDDEEEEDEDEDEDEENDEDEEVLLKDAPEEWKSLYGSVVWAKNDPKDPWWPSYVYNPLRTAQKIRDKALKNLNKKHGEHEGTRQRLLH